MTDYDDLRMPERDEIAALLDVTLSHGETALKRFQALREHTIYTLALATGLRSLELAALTVGHVYDAQGRVRDSMAITTYKGAERRNHKPQRVEIPAPIADALDAFYRAKHAARESLAPDAPLFLSQKGEAISTRQLRRAFKAWQSRAGIETDRTFHGLRHFAITSFFEESGDLAATAAQARHADPSTTARIYIHANRRKLKSAANRAASKWLPKRKAR